MITLSVASILLSVAVPSYRSFVQDSLMITQSNSFYSALALAKVKRLNVIFEQQFAPPPTVQAV